MKKLTAFLAVVLPILLCPNVFAQTICDPMGNLVIYSNYDGGSLTINVDENIPNLKIGISTYEACVVNVVGPFAGNVTGLIYAGWDSEGGCSGLNTTVINGIPPGLVTQYSSENIAISPFLEVPIFPGFPPISNCIVSNSDCNTSETPLTVQFFLAEFGVGTVLRSHQTQYDCWNNFTRLVSQGGNCCLQDPVTPPNPIYQGGANYDFIPEDTLQLCNGSITIDLSFYPAYVQPSLYPGYVWSDGTTGPVITIDQPGTYSMTVGDACHSPQTYLLEDQVVVVPCEPEETCTENGNVVVFSNYDGGELVIDIDEDIPNLKIGIAAYEPTEVSFTGAFVGNITEVIYAGFQPNSPGNGHCGTVNLTSVNAPVGVPVQILDQPPVTVLSPEVEIFPGFFLPAGNNVSMIGSISCDNASYQGGVNTAEQVIAFFLEAFGGELLFLKTQYGCWCGTQNLSQPASCCTVLTNEETVTIEAIPGTDLCAGPVTLDAGPGYDTYTWSTGANTQSITISQGGDFTVNVTSECGQASDVITINPCDDPLEVSLTDFTICLGESVDIEAVATGGVEPYMYAWSPALGNSPGPFTVSPPSTTTYTVAVSDALGAVVSATATVTVIDENIFFNPLPDQQLCDPPLVLDATVPDATSYLWSTGATTPTISVDQTGTYTVTANGQCGSATGDIGVIDCVEALTVALSDQTICPGEDAVLEALVSGGLAPFTFSWSPDVGNTAGPFVVSPASTTTYTVSVTDAEGTQTGAAATITVIDENIFFNPLPDQELCDPPLVLDATVPDATSYLWSTGATTPTISVDQTGNYTVTVNGQCGSATGDIGVIDCVEALTVALSDQTICPGEDAVLEALVSGGLAPFTFSWSPDVGNAAGPFVVSPASTTTYTVSVTDAEGTQAGAAATITVIDENIFFNPLPDQELCDPPLALDATIPDATSYLWSTGATTPTISVDQTGTYTVTVNGQCGSATGDIGVIDCVEALTVHLADTAICPGTSVVVEALVEGGVPPYTYTWSISGLEGPGPFVLEPEFSQIISVEVSDGENNAASDIGEVQVISSFVELNLPDTVRLCAGTQVEVSAEISSAVGYLWSNGDTTSTLIISRPGLYTVAINTPCVAFSESVEAVERVYPVSRLSPLRQQACEEDGPVIVGLAPADSVSVFWESGPSGYSLEVDESGLYSLYYQTPCKVDSLTFEVEFTDCLCEIFVPNAFTPDEDGLNDVFRPEVNCAYENYRFEIFNRWGTPIFVSNHHQQGWNGSDNNNGYYSNSGVYTWRLFLEKTGSPAEIIERKGIVVLVR